MKKRPFSRRPKKNRFSTAWAAGFHRGRLQSTALRGTRASLSERGETRLSDAVRLAPSAAGYAAPTRRRSVALSRIRRCGALRARPELDPFAQPLQVLGQMDRKLTVIVTTQERLHDVDAHGPADGAFPLTALPPRRAVAERR